MKNWNMISRLNRNTKFSIFYVVIILILCSFGKSDKKEIGFLILMKEQTVFIESNLKDYNGFLNVLNGSIGYELSYREYSKSLASKAKYYDAEVNYRIKDSSFTEKTKVGFLPVEIKYRSINRITPYFSNVLFRIRGIDYVFKFDMNNHRDVIQVIERN